MVWKSGRGKLGLFKPVLGTWNAEADSKMGHVTCRRQFDLVLGGKYLQLLADWKIGTGSTPKPYSEKALFGVDADGRLSFWSFTSDGKQSTGWISKADDIHSDAICFESDMPAGRARQVYSPHPETGFFWIAEAQAKNGWTNMAKHHYLPV